MNTLTATAFYFTSLSSIVVSRCTLLILHLQAQYCENIHIIGILLEKVTHNESDKCEHTVAQHSSLSEKQCSPPRTFMLCTGVRIMPHRIFIAKLCLVYSDEVQGKLYHLLHPRAY